MILVYAWHLMIDFCLWGWELKRRRLSEEEARAGTATDIITYGIPLTPVFSLNYIERVLLASESDCLEVVFNLRRAQ